MQVHLVQMDIAWEDRSANFAKVRAMVGSTRIDQGDLVVLPEMFDSGFSLNIETTHDGEGASARFLAQLATDLGAFVQGGITAIRSDGRGLNRSLTFDPSGTQIAQYDKMHPFTFGREGERFARGELVVGYDWKAAGPEQPGLRVCPVICYDLRFPELFRAGLGQGAEAFAIGANWPVDRQEHWRALLVARAIENQAYVLATNRTGSDPHLRYVGGSAVVDPKGRIIAEAGDEEIVVRVGIELSELRGWREQFPAWRDQHPALGTGAN